MAGKSAILTIKILTDASKSSKGLDEASGRLDKFRGKVGKLAAPAAVVGAALVGFSKAAVDSASRLDQAYGALDSVFGDNAKTVKAWSEAAADAVGLSKAEYSEFASVIGAQLKNLTGDADVALAGTKDLISLGADLAATFGGTTTEAVEALSSALRGEADPAERYGLSLNQTAINAELAAKGLDKLKGDQLKAAKAQTVLALATKQAGGALGQFGREADTAAGQSQRAAAQWENAKATLGTSLLPVVTAVTRQLAAMASWMDRNSTATKILLGVAAAFSVTILTLVGALKVYTATTAAVTAAQELWAVQTVTTRIGLAALRVQAIATAAATKVLAAGQWALNAALAANPVGLIIAAVIALIALIVLLWKKNDGFRRFVIAAWKQIAAAASVAWKAIKAIAGVVFAALRAYLTVYKTVAVAAFNAVKAVAAVAWNAIKAVVNVVVWAIRAYLTGLKTAASAVWTAIRTAASTAWNAIKATASRVLSAISTALSTLKTKAAGIWSAMSSAAVTAFNKITGPVNTLLGAIRSVISAVRSLIGWLGKIKVPKISLPKIPGLPGGTSTSAATTRHVGAVGRGIDVGALAAASGPTVININVSGTLNDVDAARALRRVLRDDSRRRRGVRVGPGVLA